MGNLNKTNSKNNKKSAKETQVGGSHYKDLAIQPIDYTLKNGLGFCEGNVVKYVTRYKHKNGILDLKKARHYLDILIENLEQCAEPEYPESYIVEEDSTVGYCVVELPEGVSVFTLFT